MIAAQHDGNSIDPVSQPRPAVADTVMAAAQLPLQLPLTQPASNMIVPSFNNWHCDSFQHLLQQIPDNIADASDPFSSNWEQKAAPEASATPQISPFQLQQRPRNHQSPSQDAPSTQQNPQTNSQQQQQNSTAITDVASTSSGARGGSHPGLTGMRNITRNTGQDAPSPNVPSADTTGCGSSLGSGPQAGVSGLGELCGVDSALAPMASMDPMFLGHFGSLDLEALGMDLDIEALMAEGPLGDNMWTQAPGAAAAGSGSGPQQQQQQSGQTQKGTDAAAAPAEAAPPASAAGAEEARSSGLGGTTSSGDLVGQSFTSAFGQAFTAEQQQQLLAMVAAANTNMGAAGAVGGDVGKVGSSNTEQQAGGLGGGLSGAGGSVDGWQQQMLAQIQQLQQQQEQQAEENQRQQLWVQQQQQQMAAQTQQAQREEQQQQQHLGLSQSVPLQGVSQEQQQHAPVTAPSLVPELLQQLQQQRQQQGTPKPQVAGSDGPGQLPSLDTSSFGDLGAAARLLQLRHLMNKSPGHDQQPQQTSSGNSGSMLSVGSEGGGGAVSSRRGGLIDHNTSVMEESQRQHPFQSQQEQLALLQQLLLHQKQARGLVGSTPFLDQLSCGDPGGPSVSGAADGGRTGGGLRLRTSNSGGSTGSGGNHLTMSSINKKKLLLFQRQRGHTRVSFNSYSRPRQGTDMGAGLSFVGASSLAGHDGQGGVGHPLSSAGPAPTSQSSPTTSLSKGDVHPSISSGGRTGSGGFMKHNTTTSNVEARGRRTRRASDTHARLANARSCGRTVSFTEGHPIVSGVGGGVGGAVGGHAGRVERSSSFNSVHLPGGKRTLSYHELLPVEGSGEVLGAVVAAGGEGGVAATGGVGASGAVGASGGGDGMEGLAGLSGGSPGSGVTASPAIADGSAGGSEGNAVAAAVGEGASPQIASPSPALQAARALIKVLQKLDCAQLQAARPMLNQILLKSAPDLLPFSGHIDAMVHNMIKMQLEQQQQQQPVPHVFTNPRPPAIRARRRSSGCMTVAQQQQFQQTLMQQQGRASGDFGLESMPNLSLGLAPLQEGVPMQEEQQQPQQLPMQLQGLPIQLQIQLLQQQLQQQQQQLSAGGTAAMTVGAGMDVQAMPMPLQQLQTQSSDLSTSLPLPLLQYQQQQGIFAQLQQQQQGGLGGGVGVAGCPEVGKLQQMMQTLAFPEGTAAAAAGGGGVGSAAMVAFSNDQLLAITLPGSTAAVAPDGPQYDAATSTQRGRRQRRKSDLVACSSGYAANLANAMLLMDGAGTSNSTTLSLMALLEAPDHWSPEQVYASSSNPLASLPEGIQLTMPVGSGSSQPLMSFPSPQQLQQQEQGVGGLGGGQGAGGDSGGGANLPLEMLQQQIPQLQQQQQQLWVQLQQHQRQQQQQLQNWQQQQQGMLSPGQLASPGQQQQQAPWQEQQQQGLVGVQQQQQQQSWAPQNSEMQYTEDANGFLKMFEDDA